MPTCSDAVDQEHPLREEEITDINLSTFYISDRERTPPLLPRIAAGACVACAASSEQPAYSGPVTRMSPPARKPTRPDVQTFKRPQEMRPVPSTNASRNQLEARPRATDQNAGRDLCRSGPSRKRSKRHWTSPAWTRRLSHKSKCGPSGGASNGDSSCSGRGPKTVTVIILPPQRASTRCPEPSRAIL